MERIMRMMKIKDIMNAQPLVLLAAMNVAEAVRSLLPDQNGPFPLVDEEGAFISIVYIPELLKAVLDGEADNRTLASLGQAPKRLLDPDDSADQLLGKPVDSLPVIEDGKLAGIVGVPEMAAYALSVRSRAEELSNLVDYAYNPIVAVDLDNRIWVYNKALERVTGLNAADCLGQDINKTLPMSRLPEVLETGLTQTTQKVVYGNTSFLSNRAPIYHDNQISGAVAILQEISELEAVSQELEYVKRLNCELDAIIESSFDGLYITDGQGYTIRVNKGFERITGSPAREHYGRHMAELVEEGFYSRSGTLLALEAREPVTITLETITGKNVLVTSSPIFDAKGEITLVVTNVRDITELNELQRRLDQAESLSHLYQNELQQLKVVASGEIIMRSPRMEEIFGLAIRLAAVDSTVMIKGESGVGKEMIADLIHSSSQRKNGPIVKVNCGAIPETLLESELFGYESGAFTGARKEGKPGFFEVAHGGTLFLDEIGDLPRNLQVKFLRVLQDRTVTRVGGTKPIPVNVRILAGTNRDLDVLVEDQQFREDLYYRLNVVPLDVPPLRERRDDITPLIDHFLEYYNERYHMNKRLAPGVMEILLDYHWPGNVRELQNLVERLVVVTTDNLITVDDLPPLNQAASRTAAIRPLKSVVEEAERDLLNSAFARYNSTYEVARALKVNQSTIVRKAARYGIRTGLRHDRHSAN